MISFSARILIALSLTVLVGCGNQVPDFTLLEPKIEKTVQPGSSLTVPVGINRVGGFNDSVRVSLVSPPSGITAHSVMIEPGDTTASLVIKTSDRAAMGPVPLTIRTVSTGAPIKLASLTLNVGDEPGLKCSLEQSRVSVAQNATANIKVRLDRQNFKDAVIVAFTALPAGLRASDAVVAGDESEAILQLTATGTASPTAEPAITSIAVTSVKFGTELLNLEVNITPGSGSLDPSFGMQGKAITTVSGDADAANAMTVQPDGKVVVAGGSQGQFSVLRFGRDGGPDVGFGVGGVRLTAFDANAEALAVAMQPDAKIVLAGRSGKRFALARYRSNGSLDAGFGDGGKVTGALVNDQDNTYYAVAAQPDGKILAAGTSAGQIVLARYSSDGTLDAGFGSNGYAVLDVVGDGERAYAMAVQPDGKILIAGRAAASVGLFVARYNADGLLDTDFGTGGATTKAVGSNLTAARALLLQPDGGIVLAGFADFGSNGSDTLIARVRADGTFDPGFGQHGLTLTDVRPGRYDYAYGLSVQSDGKLVTAGNAVNATGDKLDVVLVRYEGNGGLDESFGRGGIRVQSFGSSVRANAVVMQANGILVGGTVGADSDQDVILARFMR